MKKKVVISDTNIIIYLCSGNVFQHFCSSFSVHVAGEVIEEIRKGRASKAIVDLFFKESQKGNLTNIKLDKDELKLRDDLMSREGIGLGEAASIIASYNLEDSFFATNDGSAFLIAQDLLGTNQVLSCEDILEALLLLEVITKEEFDEVNRLFFITSTNYNG